MSHSNWKSSKIYVELKKRKGDFAEKIINLLERPEVMDKIELILNKGGSTPKNFTLHDADHSFRVADRMWELIPDKTKATLGDYELGLLLLSAYLHDIGMSPDFEKVQQHKAYLTSSEKIGLSEQDVESFQKWIDNNNSLKAIDISKDIVEDEKLSDYILSYYIRSRHNDWSGEWIENNLKQLKLKNFDDWVDDLILICKSHHEGLEHLKSESFDPRPMGSKKIIHRRYLAMCLRVADVMENDPERTPDVILQHRMIDENSLIYWLKDKKFELIRKGDEFTVYARPEKALLHKAIEETTDWIETELKLCEELIKIKPLNVCAFCNLMDYNWEIASFIHRDIVPKDELYVYINSGFRPNTTKILDLLGGNQLYGDPKWAYREIFQNALDAVKERIAYQVVNDTSKDSELISKLFAKLYSIDISLDMRKDGLWLTVKDQGVGMTKSIIEKYFLESGSSKRHEISSLERRCKERGYHFTRTGQFGIGVLSYFMIAEKIILKTKRELNTGYNDSESISWQFEINGTHDFGELKKYAKPISGTEIEFKLKPVVANSVEFWDDFFKTFIKDILKKSPCTVTYSAIDNTQWTVEPGWTNTTSDIKNTILSEFSLATKSSSDNTFISSEKENSILKNNTLAGKTVSELNDNMDFLYTEGILPNFGQYRVFIPHFKLTGGKTFYYLKEEMKGGINNILKINEGHIWIPRQQNISLSMKGIRIKAVSNPGHLEILSYPDHPQARPIFENAIIDLNIDIIEEHEISISRHDYIYNDKLIEAIGEINSAILTLIDQNKNNFDNIYGSLNYKFTGIQPEVSYWAFPSEQNSDESLIWREIIFPIMIYDFFSYYTDSTYNGNKIDLLESIRSYSSSSSSAIDWQNQIVESYKLANPLGYAPRIIIEKPLLYSSKKSFRLIELTSKFKDSLFYDPEYITFYSKVDKIYLNKNSKFYKYFDHGLFTNIQNDVKGNIEKIDTTDPNMLFNLLISILIGRGKEDWIGICEKKSELIESIFKHIQTDNISFLKHTEHITISLNKWEVSSLSEVAKGNK